MSVHRDPDPAPASAVPVPAVARAAAAAARADRQAAGHATDLFLPDDARLDERTRAGARALLRSLVAAVERDLRIGAARRLAERGAEAAAARLAEANTPLWNRLAAAGVLADEELAAEAVARVRMAQLAADLPAAASGTERPSLLVRLADCPEPAVARAATALMHTANETRDGTVALPDELHTRLLWWAAAALADAADAAQAVAEAAVALAGAPLAADEEQAAAVLATAIAARADELPDLLIECLGDRQPALFVALVADALALASADVRAALLDRDAARAALMLRAAGLDRSAIARIGVVLAEADPRRDLERFADQLDAVMALDAAEAAAALAPLALPAPFRRARRALERGR